MKMTSIIVLLSTLLFTSQAFSKTYEGWIVDSREAPVRTVIVRVQYYSKSRFYRSTPVEYAGTKGTFTIDISDEHGPVEGCSVEFLRESVDTRELPRLLNYDAYQNTLEDCTHITVVHIPTLEIDVRGEQEELLNTLDQLTAARLSNRAYLGFADPKNHTFVTMRLDRVDYQGDGQTNTLFTDWTWPPSAPIAILSKTPKPVTVSAQLSPETHVVTEIGIDDVAGEGFTGVSVDLN